MAQGKPVIVDIAINGENTKEVNPNIPRTPDEIVTEALLLFGAGASVIHAHNRSASLTGAEAAEDYLAAWQRVLAERPSALWYPTLTRSGGDDLEHVRLIREAIGLRIGCIDPGAINIGRPDEDGLPTGGAYANSFTQIRKAFATLNELRLGPQIGIYEPSYLRTVLAYYRAGQLPPGAMINFYFGGEYGMFGAAGSGFGLPPTRLALQAYLEMLGNADLPWCVSVWGENVLDTPVAELALELGGHLQIGLESHRHPVNKPTNATLLAQAKDMVRKASRPIASTAQTIALLQLPTQH